MSLILERVTGKSESINSMEFQILNSESSKTISIGEIRLQHRRENSTEKLYLEIELIDDKGFFKEFPACENQWMLSGRCIGKLVSKEDATNEIYAFHSMAIHITEGNAIRLLWEFAKGNGWIINPNRFNFKLFLQAYLVGNNYMLNI